jgi:hypothetical protein
MLILSAVCGFINAGTAFTIPFTSKILAKMEARLIQKYYGQTISAMAAFDKWDLWDSSVPDGTYDYRPDSLPGTYIDSSELGLILEYCYSPLKNPAASSSLTATQSVTLIIGSQRLIFLKISMIFRYICKGRSVSLSI